MLNIGRFEAFSSAIRSDHSVRINVCKGVPQGHIDRITRLMKENGVTNYRFVRQQ